MVVVLLLACLGLVSGALAQPKWPPEAVWAEAQARWPGYALTAWVQEGEEQALLLNRDKESALILLQEAEGAVQLVFSYARPVYPGSRPFDLRFEGPDALTWQSNTREAAEAGQMTDNSSLRYIARRTTTGWVFSAVERLTGMNREGIAHREGLLHYYAEGPAFEGEADQGWAPYTTDNIPMADFDATTFPHSRDEALSVEPASAD